MSKTSLTLTGTFSPKGEPGPSNAEEFVEQVNEFLINYWEGGEDLRLEVAEQDTHLVASMEADTVVVVEGNIDKLEMWWKPSANIWLSGPRASGSGPLATPRTRSCPP